MTSLEHTITRLDDTTLIGTLMGLLSGNPIRHLRLADRNFSGSNGMHSAQCIGIHWVGAPG